MASGETGKHHMQRRRFYLEDRMEDIADEIERFDDESTRLKAVIAGRPTGETLTKAQRRLNYIRERLVLLRAERTQSAAERTDLIKQLREAAGRSA